MGAFDHLSDDDERVILHEENKLHRNCGLDNYTVKQLKEELLRRKKATSLKRKKVKK